jgi:hypothetical protein
MQSCSITFESSFSGAKVVMLAVLRSLDFIEDGYSKSTPCVLTPLPAPPPPPPEREQRIQNRLVAFRRVTYQAMQPETK